MKKRIMNILFYSLIVIILVFTLSKTKEYNNYTSINTIYDNKTIKKYSKNRLVKINSDNIVETRFKIAYQNNNYKICYVRFDNVTLLLELNDKDLNKKEIIGELKSPTSNIVDLQNKLENEEKINDFSDKYLTVKNNKTINKINIIKLFLLFSVLIISLLSIIYNLIKLILQK